MPREPALLTSAGRMPERSQHRVSEGQDARSERPATGHGQPRSRCHTTPLYSPRPRSQSIARLGQSDVPAAFSRFCIPKPWPPAS